MILVLSCFDLAAVAIVHPLLIASAILWSMQSYREIHHASLFLIIYLGGFSMLALLALNIERFLALIFPFFHQSTVTKTRISTFLVFSMMIQVTLSPLLYFYGSVLSDSLITVFIIVVLCTFIYLNYKILFIAKSKFKDRRVAPADAATGSSKKAKKRKIDFQNISTCCLAVGCFSILSLPEIIYSHLSGVSCLTSQRMI